jgi:hypothetical protein
MLKLNDYYYMIEYDGQGNTTFSEHKLQFLKAIKNLLIEKYSESNCRVKFLSLCIIRAETKEFDTQDKDWVRSILHAEFEPELHTGLLEELEELDGNIWKSEIYK